MSGGPYNYNYIFKYIIIGDMGVGKSCILHQFTEKKCEYFLSSLPVDVIFVSRRNVCFFVCLFVQIEELKLKFWFHPQKLWPIAHTQ